MHTVFALTSGRSGTHFLYELVRRNAKECTARHEPYGINPSMFGRPIYDHAVGDRAYTRSLLVRKRRWIERYGGTIYVETSHAFLKSWYDVALDFFPQMKLVHLVRDPIQVAKSEAYREDLLHWLRLPLRNYRGGDGKRYFRWALTGLEPIFQHFDPSKLSRLQWYVLQWIEIENRAMRFLDQFGKQSDCFTLHAPAELNNPDRIQALFDCLGLKLRQRQLVLAGWQNKNWRPTVITDEDRGQFVEIVRAVPAPYLEIFHREPYVCFPWVETMMPSS